MDIVLDVNIVADVCVERTPYFETAKAVLEKAERCDHRIWIYAGSVQTLQYVIANELRRKAAEYNKNISITESHITARDLLNAFSEDRQWLAALAEDGHVFNKLDPEDAQLIRAVKRLGGKGRLITRDENLLTICSQAISPQEYIGLQEEAAELAFIDLSRQQDHLRPQLERRVHAVLHHGRYILGPEVGELEKRLIEYVGVKHAVACSSGTDALLMTLMAWGIGPGDAVFTTPFTFIATAEVISLLGATPVFVDIDPRTFDLDPEKLALAIKAVRENDSSIYPLPLVLGSSALHPKATIPVDLFGLPADYDAIRAITDAEDILVLEDAAQSFGAVYKGRQAGSLAHAAAMSFFPAKPLGCYGDGGAVLTDEDELAHELRSICFHGKGGHKYDNVRIGLNARLDTLQAAILLTKLQVFPQEIQLRQEVAKRYSDLLNSQPSAITTPFIPNDMKSAWAQYSVLGRDEEFRNAIQAKLKESGIPLAVYYPKPLHIQTAFANLDYRPDDFPVALKTSKKIFSLPMHPYLEEAAIIEIAELLQDI